MKLDEAINQIQNLLSLSSKKSEKRIFKCFLNNLKPLKHRDFSENDLQKIESELSKLTPNINVIKPSKHYSIRLTDFKKFLKNEFSLTPERYYTELYMMYGMSMGIGVGISIGTAIDPAMGSALGISIGACLGMTFGMIYGSTLDAKAKEDGNVLI